MIAKPKQVPATPGVYIFRRGRMPLYIGKAANLKQRLASYFQKRAALPIKIQRMLGEATRLETVETASEVEALIKEAELIKKHRPKYNLLMRDDKSYFYVAITREPFPRIFATHQPRQQTRNSTFVPSSGRRKPETRNKSQSQIQNSKRVSKFGLRASNVRYIGPFTSGAALKTVLKLLRRVFPYCTCSQLHKRPCLNAQIGRCPGDCCVVPRTPVETRRRERSRAPYRRSIRNIIAVLRGKRTRLMGQLRQAMARASRLERYEEAARLRDALAGLEDIFSHRFAIRPEAEQQSWMLLEAKLRSLLRCDGPFTRIEGYDIANIGSEAATGSMIVFTNGAPDKSQYRKFRIKTVRGISDVAMLQEVLRRRLNHPEWPYPQLVVIDGGQAQLNAALAVLRAASSTKPEAIKPMVTALAKREEMLCTERGQGIRLKERDPAILHLFQRIRDASHRFARAYHHKLRERAFNPRP